MLALFDRLFLGPVLKKLNEIDTAIAAQEASIARDIRLLSYRDRILEESEIFSKYYTAQVNDESKLKGDFAKVVQRLSTDTEVEKVKSNPLEPVKERMYSLYFIEYDFAGPLKNMVSFIHSVNTTDELLKVANFKMTPKRGTDNVNASMTIAKMVINENSSNEISVVEE